MEDVAVIGVGMSRFTNYQGAKDVEDLGYEAATKALEDADIEWKQVRAAFCGSALSGNAVGHRALNQVGMTGIPIVNVENACSSAGSAFRLAYQSIASGRYDVCLALGVDVVPRGLILDASWPIYQRAMGFNVEPASYAMNARRHMADYGTTIEQIAKVTVKNRKNGALNKYCHFQKAVTVEEVLASRPISDPLKLLMCCPNAEGGAAAVLVNGRKLRRNKAVMVAASVLTSSMFGSPGMDVGVGVAMAPINPDRTEAAVKEAYGLAGCGPEDLDLIETHDAFASAELIHYERLGLCGKGEGGRLIDEGVTAIGGKIPVNPSGGLMSRGHPVGATALGQVAEIVWQLRGEAGQRQVPNARIGLGHTLGGGPNCSIIILKR
jgi:acetyl-CoA acetyltransferase